MTTIALDIPLFREQIVEFSDETTYTDAVITMNWDIATCYISDEDYGDLSGSCRQIALNLMTAHLMTISDLLQKGETPSYVSAASIDKISVTNTTPPAKDEWSYWLSITGRGQQLLALLNAKSAGGFYVGGLPETSPFRKVYGVH